MSEVPRAAPAAPTPEQMFQHWRDQMRHTVGLTARSIVLDDGLRYAYLEGGTGEPLVLLHGFGANKDNFLSIARPLMAQHRLIVPDQIGFGDSTCSPEIDHRPHEQAERLNRLMTALGVSQVHVGGSSMGGHIAMAWAARYPEQVKSLWLLCPGGAWSAPPGAAMGDSREGGANPLLPDSPEAFRRLGQLVLHQPPPALPEPLLHVMAQDRIARLPLERLVMAQCHDDPIEPRIAGLKTPTLIVWGRHDQIIHPASAEVLHDLLPNSRVVMMDEVGHLPAIEAPREVLQDYLAFRRGLAAAA